MPSELLAQLCDRSVESFRPERWRKNSFVYIDVSAIDTTTKRIVTAKEIATSEAPSRAQQIVRTGDILVSNVRPNLNAVCKIVSEFDSAVCSSAFSVLRCTPALDPDYLFCYVQSPQFIDRMVSVAQGAHYPAVTDRQVFATRLDCPNVEEQRLRAQRVLACLRESRIAAIACEGQRTLSMLVAERTLTECFHGTIPISSPLRFAGPRAGWTWHALPELASLESGHTPSRRHPEWWGGKIPWLALPDIRKLHGKHAYETTEYTNDAGIANSSARILPVGTVCVSRTASIGFVTILGKPMATSQDFCNWVCGPELDPEFLMYAFMASQESLRELGSGAVHKTIYMPTIESFHICAPDIAEQRRIARRLRERLSAAETLTERLTARLTEIERLPQRLLAAAFG